MLFFRFSHIYISYRRRKTIYIDFPEKGARTKFKYLLSVCRILRNFAKGNARKFTASFALWEYNGIKGKAWKIQGNVGKHKEYGETTSCIPYCRNRVTQRSSLEGALRDDARNGC